MLAARSVLVLRAALVLILLVKVPVVVVVRMAVVRLRHRVHPQAQTAAMVPRVSGAALALRHRTQVLRVAAKVAALAQLVQVARSPAATAATVSYGAAAQVQVQVLARALA